MFASNATAASCIKILGIPQLGDIYANITAPCTVTLATTADPTPVGQRAIIRTVFEGIDLQSLNPDEQGLFAAQVKLAVVVASKTSVGNDDIESAVLTPGSIVATTTFASHVRASSVAALGAALTDTPMLIRHNGRVFRATASIVGTSTSAGDTVSPTASPTWDACHSRPCTNNGTCILRLGERLSLGERGEGDFVCRCQPEWQGQLYAQDVDECQSSECRNGAICSNFKGGFRCICNLGFEGELCAQDVDECASAPCLHGGACTTPKPNEFACQCTHAYRGVVCSFAVNPCEDNTPNAMTTPCACTTSQLWSVPQLH